MFYSNLESFDDNNFFFEKQFNKAIEEAWGSLGCDYFGSLIRSMERRVNSVLEAMEGHTSC